MGAIKSSSSLFPLGLEELISPSSVSSNQDKDPRNRTGPPWTAKEWCMDPSASNTRSLSQTLDATSAFNQSSITKSDHEQQVCYYGMIRT
mmetsp:Transcript_14218/g.29470  ORF Transcript_14218/g.29470 Transcript_14218/m.29470 type:complete len:90 (+) Transcript_14218:1307-1576(+)